MAVQGKLPDAEKAFLRAVELNPGFTEGSRLLAEFYLVTGNAAKAEPLLTKAIKASPKEPQLYAALGLVYARQNLPEKAEAAFNTAIKMLPPSLALPTRLNKARAIFVQGRYNEAVRELNAILKAAPTFAGAKLELANCYFAMENFDAARKLYKEVQKLEPDNKELKALMDALDARQKEYALKSKDHLRASQILVGSQAEAETVLKELAAGAEFGAVARKRSLSPEAAIGGDLGFFKRGDLMPELEQSVVALKVGQISGVVKTSRGYHIFVRKN